MCERKRKFEFSKKNSFRQHLCGRKLLGAVADKTCPAEDAHAEVLKALDAGSAPENKVTQGWHSVLCLITRE